MKQATYDLRYLAACAVKGIKPAKEKVDTMDLEKIHKMSRMHSLSALTAMTLSSAEIEISSEWKADKENAIRNSILFDAEGICFVKLTER